MMKSMKIGLAALAAVVMLVGSANAAVWRSGPGGTQYTEYNGHWYGLSDAGTWDEAQAEAVAEGVAATADTGWWAGAWSGSLVKIEDAAENAWLLQTMFASPDVCVCTPIPHLWIGATDVAEETVWVWTDGTDLSGYSNFISPEPNNGTACNWAAIRDYPDGDPLDGSWNDYNTTGWTSWGYGEIQGIIELTPAAIPAPGAILIAGIGTACVGYLRRRRAV